MRLFVDANVLVAVLNKEYPTFTYAARVISLADHPGYEVWTSPICLAIAFYFSEKKSGAKHAKDKMLLLAERLRISTTDHRVVFDTMENPKVLDVEDGLEYYSALNADCKYIITEDTGDFHFSKIPVSNCEDFLTQHF
ncbi:MAG: PIN domain-containing protein [Bacteroidota bacterium]